MEPARVVEIERVFHDLAPRLTGATVLVGPGRGGAAGADRVGVLRIDLPRPELIWSGLIPAGEAGYLRELLGRVLKAVPGELDLSPTGWEHAWTTGTEEFRLFTPRGERCATRDGAVVVRRRFLPHRLPLSRIHQVRASVWQGAPVHRVQLVLDDGGRLSVARKRAPAEPPDPSWALRLGRTLAGVLGVAFQAITTAPAEPPGR